MLPIRKQEGFSCSLTVRSSLDTPSGDEPESEEDGEQPMPYPLEGKYVDENDRQRYVVSRRGQPDHVPPAHVFGLVNAPQTRANV